MSRWLALASEAGDEPLTSCDSVTKHDKTPSTQPERGFCQVLSHCHTGTEDKPAPAPDTDKPRHTSICGWPKTWTGKIVSLDEWRTLSAWDKHGPDGRHWNGITRKWEELA